MTALNKGASSGRSSAFATDIIKKKHIIDAASAIINLCCIFICIHSVKKLHITIRADSTTFCADGSGQDEFYCIMSYNVILIRINNYVKCRYLVPTMKGNKDIS